MSDEDAIRRSHEAAEKALRKMMAARLEATPQNYEVWYAYSWGQNPELNRDINTVLRAGDSVNQKFLDQVREKHFETSSVDMKLDRLGGAISGKVDAIVDMVQEAMSQTSSYNDSLRGATRDLSQADDRVALEKVVKKLMTMTEAAEKNNDTLSEQLARSQAEIAALRENLEEVRAESLTDQLTGLYNRKRFDRAMDEILAASIASGDGFSLLVTDIDHFKKFNDTHGHQTGDQVLRLVGATLKANVKGQDIPCRYGGEEFCIILPGTPIDLAERVAENIRVAVMGKELVKKSTGDNLGRVTISIGVAYWREGDTTQSMIERADQCLYAAKRNGRNQVVREDSPIALEEVA